MNIVRVLLGLIMFSVFFGNSLVSYGLLPSILNTVLPDLAIVGLVLFALTRVRSRDYRLFAVGFGFVVWLIAFTILSTVITDSAWISALLLLRLLVRFYVMFIALINIGLSERTLQWVIRILTFLFLIQIPVAVVKLMIHGQGESAIGTYAVHGGGLSTAIPMVAAAFLVSFYIGYRQRFIYLVLLAGFIAFGIIGGKRAIFVLVPLIGLISLWMSLDYSIGRLLKQMPHIFGIAIIFSVALYATVRLTPTLNPERMVMGSFDSEYLTEFIMKDQVDAYTQNDEAQGRFSSTQVFVDSVNEKFSTAVSGYGPGTLLKTSIEGAGRESSEDMYGMQYGGGLERFGVVYGVTGFAWLLVQIGWPGTIVWLGFYLYMFGQFRKFSKEEHDPFWKSFQRSMAVFSFVVILISLIYGSFMIMGDLMVFVYFLLSTIAFIKRRQNVIGVVK